MNNPHTILLTVLLVGFGGGSSAQTEPTIEPAKQPKEPGAVQTQTAAPQSQPTQNPADEPKKRKKYIPRFGVDLGYERLISARTRSVFGNGGGFNFGPGFGAISVSERGGLSISPDFNIFSSSKKVRDQSNKIFMVGAGAAFRYTIPMGSGGPPNDPGDGPGGDGPAGGILSLLSPYVEFGIGLTYADINARSEGISGKRFSYSGSIALGTTISNRAFLQLRCRVAPKILTFDTNSLGFEFGVRF